MHGFSALPIVPGEGDEDSKRTQLPLNLIALIIRYVRFRETYSPYSVLTL